MSLQNHSLCGCDRIAQHPIVSRSFKNSPTSRPNPDHTAPRPRPHLAHIPTTPRLYLAHTSHTSRPRPAQIPATSRPHTANIPLISRQHLRPRSRQHPAHIPPRLAPYLRLYLPISLIHRTQVFHNLKKAINMSYTNYPRIC